jgi:hypothetical protein
MTYFCEWWCCCEDRAHGSYNLSQIFGKVRLGEGCRFPFMLNVFDEWFVRSFCVGLIYGARDASKFQATIKNVLISSRSCNGILYEELRERQMFPG